MSGEAIRPEIQEFLADKVRSVERLEILLLLRSKPESPWSAKSVFQIVLSSETSIENALEDFVRFEFVTRIPEPPMSYRYNPYSSYDALIEELQQVNKLKPARVVEALYRRQIDVVQSFADAFKLRPKE